MKKLTVINQQFIEAAINNQLDELKNLLSQGADIHADNDNALRWSAACGHIETVKFLVMPDLGSVAITHGANIHADNDAALKYSAFFGHLEVVKFLIAQGADIHADNNYALRYSALKGHLKIVKFLVTQGANIHANNDEALKNAASKNHNDVWQVLSAFIQEKKLLVAASGSTSASSCLRGMPVLPGASIWFY